jgi:hypothetical protein
VKITDEMSAAMSSAFWDRQESTDPWQLVLSAVAPLIRAAVLEEAAKHIEGMKQGNSLDIVVQGFANAIRALIELRSGTGESK